MQIEKDKEQSYALASDEGARELSRRDSIGIDQKPCTDDDVG